jgi:hypothetical protein
MVDYNAALLLYRNALALLCAVSISASPAVPAKEIVNVRHFEKILIDKNPWPYLRSGINYLEASGKEVPLNYKHPGGKAYGPLALTPIAIRDVKLHYPSLSHYTLDDVLSDRFVYEKFAYFYAELLLKHYIKVDYLHMPRKEVFDILQKAWFLGPGLYKKGHSVIASRKIRAKEFTSLPFLLTAHTI